MRRVSGFILTILGAFLLVVAVLLRVWVAPSVIEFPLDEYQIVQLAGTGSYFSPAKEKELVGVSVLVTETTKGADVAGSGGAAVWDGFVAVQDTTNRTGYLRGPAATPSASASATPTPTSASS